MTGNNIKKLPAIFFGLMVGGLGCDSMPIPTPYGQDAGLVPELAQLQLGLDDLTQLQNDLGITGEQLVAFQQILEQSQADAGSVTGDVVQNVMLLYDAIQNDGDIGPPVAALTETLLQSSMMQAGTLLQINELLTNEQRAVILQYLQKKTAGMLERVAGPILQTDNPLFQNPIIGTALMAGFGLGGQGLFSDGALFENNWLDALVGQTPLAADENAFAATAKDQALQQSSLKALIGLTDNQQQQIPQIVTELFPQAGEYLQAVSQSRLGLYDAVFTQAPDENGILSAVGNVSSTMTDALINSTDLRANLESVLSQDQLGILNQFRTGQ